VEAWQGSLFVVGRKSHHKATADADSARKSSLLFLDVVGSLLHFRSLVFYHVSMPVYSFLPHVEYFPLWCSFPSILAASSECWSFRKGTRVRVFRSSALGMPWSVLFQISNFSCSFHPSTFILESESTPSLARSPMVRCICSTYQSCMLHHFACFLLQASACHYCLIQNLNRYGIPAPQQPNNISAVISFASFFSCVCGVFWVRHL